MKILQFIYDLGSGGAEKFIVNLSNSLVEEGHEVILLQLLDDNVDSRNFNRQFLSNKVKYINGGLSKGFSLSKVAHISKLVSDQKPDIVHAHLNVVPYIWPLILSKRKNMRFVHTLHSLAQYTVGTKAQKPINRFLYKYGFITPVTISAQCDKSYKDFYGLTNSIHIDNGSPAAGMSTNFDNVVKEIKQYKHTPDTKVLIHVGRCSPMKNQKLLIEAFNQVKRTYEDSILLVIGNGFNSTEGRKLKELANHDIHFIGVKGNVGDYLLNSDIFCLSSDYEGLPISVLEAFSAGVMPVCTPVGGIPDIITDGVNGYLSVDCSVEEYSKALIRAIIEPILPDRIIKIFEQGYSMRNCAQRYINLYRSLK